jgi:hypothetical protein
MGGSITASNARYGAGIGAGYAESYGSCANTGDLTILSGHVIATSKHGAAIGGGYSKSGSTNVIRLRISNAVVQAGASSIGGGSGPRSNVSDLAIFDSNLTVSDFSGVQHLMLGGRISLDCFCIQTPSSIAPDDVNAVRIRSGRVFSSVPSIAKEGAVALTIMYDYQTQSISEDLPYSPLFTYMQIGKMRLLLKYRPEPISASEWNKAARIFPTDENSRWATREARKICSRMLNSLST